jgi:capsular polysaccharide biosynthesis protein
MDTNQTNGQNVKVEDEISLKELILVLWKRKVMIISIAMIFALLAGVLSLFVISPVYNTKLNIIVSMPENYQTRYGGYKLPLTTNEQYAQLFTSNDVLVRTIRDLKLVDKMSVEDLKNKISIQNSSKDAPNGNTFEITVSSNNPDVSLELAKTLYSNYVDFLDIMVNEQVVTYFYNNFSVELITLENSLNREQQILKTNEELISQTKMELGTNNAGIGIVEQLGGDGNYVVPVHTINPNYIKLETDIINNKQAINNLVNTIDRNKKYIAELEKEKQAIQEFYDTGKEDTLKLNLISIIESNVSMPSLPIVPSVKTSPSTVVNVAIGTMLGGMLGIMIALCQWYWRKE